MPLPDRNEHFKIGVDDMMVTQQFISQSTSNKIQRKYKQLGHIRNAPVNKNNQQVVILSAVGNDLNSPKTMFEFEYWKVCDIKTFKKVKITFLQRTSPP